MQEKKMGPLTWLIAGLIAGGGAGFGVAWSVRGDRAEKVLEQQTDLIAALQEGQATLLEEANKPVVIEGQIKEKLANTPIQCIKTEGGDPNSVQCQWATCAQFGQSAAQRPECGDVKDLLVEVLRAKHGLQRSR